MRKENFVFDEKQLANRLRREVQQVSESCVKPETRKDLSEFEMVSEVQKPYVSPIFTMNEDEILAFVEEFGVNELATLSVAELNKIGEVLGVDPTILAGVEDI